MIYKIKNWQDFQHYKDRAPPWIKLHNTLLTTEVWVMGNDATRALVVASMLLASRNSENDGTFNGDPEYVKRFGYLNSKPDFKPLIEHGFIELVQDASNVLDKCNTEERREEENRGEKKATGKPSFDPAGIALPLCIPREVWMEGVAYRRERKLTCSKRTMEAQVDNLVIWFDKGHYPPDVIKASISNGWQGLFEPKGDFNGNRKESVAATVAAFTGKRTEPGEIFQGTAERVN